MFRTNGRRSRCALTLPAAVLLASSSVLADIQLEVVASPSPARQGETLDVEITITNDGLFDRTDVTMTVVTPANLDTLFDSLFDGDCPGTTCDVGEIATFAIAALPAGEGRTFTIPMEVAPAALDGAVITIDVEAIDDAVLEASATTDVDVDGTREVELALSETRDPVTPGGDIEYTLTYGVLQTSPGSVGAMLRLPLPAGTSFVSASQGGSLNAGVVEWSLGNLNPGATGECTAILAVDGGLDTGSIVVAHATYEDVSAPVNLVAYETATRVQADIPLELLVSASPDPARQGETLDVELTVTNNGFFDRSGVVVLLEIPDHLDTLFDSLFDGDCVGTTCDRQERATFDVGTLPAGEGLTFSVPMEIALAALNGTVLSIEAEVTDSTGEVREGGASIAVDGTREVELALVESRDPVTAGGDIEYTLTYGVIETSAGAPAAMLRLPLPPGATLVSASHGGTEVDGVVEWSLGALNPGATGERIATVVTDAGAEAGSIVRAQATFDDGALPLGAVAYDTAVRVQEAIPLELRVSASPDPARPGETLDVELMVTNTGVFDRSGVTVRLEIPDHLDTLFDSLFDGDCVGTTCDRQETATFDLGTLPAGEGWTFSVPVQMGLAVADGTVVTLEAEVTDSTGELRESGASVAVDETREFDLAIVESDEPIGPGGQATYTLTYGALVSDDGVADGRLTFIPPAGATVGYISDGGALSEGIVEWSIGAMNPGAGGERVVRVTLAGSAGAGTIYNAAARFRDESEAGIEMRFDDTMRIGDPSALDVELTAAPAAAASGDDIFLDLSVTNTSGVDRNDIVLTLEIPEGLATLFDSTFDGDCVGTTCDDTERATFTVAFLDAGETVSFPVATAVSAVVPHGRVINFDAFVTDPTGVQAADGDAVFVGAVFDAAVGGDINADGAVDVVDLLAFLGAWGPCPDPDACLEDFDGDGDVDTTDLLIMLGAWG